MKNLEQIRAAAALPVAERTVKADVNKLPALIVANGLLATAAFANEDDGTKRPKMAAVVNGVARHLANVGILSRCTDAKSMMQRLCSEDSPVLQRATAEALAFIGYVKRFAPKGESEAEE